MCLLRVFAYHFLVGLLQVSVALVHVVPRSPERHHVTLAHRVRERDLHLVELVTDLPDAATLGADEGAVETLVYEDVTRLLVLLGEYKERTKVNAN